MGLKECNRKNTCFDCDNTKCYHAGKKEADCPKYRCDMPEPITNDCEHCLWLDRWYKSVKAEIQGGSCRKSRQVGKRG